MAIMHPLKPRMSRSTTLNICVWIWVFSILLSFPNLLYSMTIIEEFQDGGNRVICFMFWPDGPSNESNQEYIRCQQIAKSSSLSSSDHVFLVSGFLAYSAFFPPRPVWSVVVCLVAGSSSLYIPDPLPDSPIRLSPLPDPPMYVRSVALTTLPNFQSNGVTKYEQ
ncbi:uncharacterized protein TNCT_674441 [Trichonephila clavata]|uniref:G-protein coupled receptors family 1 profile domain-containing protein n=1 Tax=Trichonephila clavata TaxID=2740835 RepID=A0A8X6FV25_TRICU|nr:uncharacterized protein TNCT_674441 [Trichonephila clavata]